MDSNNKMLSGWRGERIRREFLGSKNKVTLLIDFVDWTTMLRKSSKMGRRGNYMIGYRRTKNPNYQNSHIQEKGRKR